MKNLIVNKALVCIVCYTRRLIFSNIASLVNSLILDLVTFYCKLDSTFTSRTPCHFLFSSSTMFHISILHVLSWLNHLFPEVKFCLWYFSFRHLLQTTTWDSWGIRQALLRTISRHKRLIVKIVVVNWQVMQIIVLSRVSRWVQSIGVYLLSLLLVTLVCSTV